jgi:hypothetical protein
VARLLEAGEEHRLGNFAAEGAPQRVDEVVACFRNVFPGVVAESLTSRPILEEIEANTYAEKARQLRDEERRLTRGDRLARVVTLVFALAWTGICGWLFAQGEDGPLFPAVLPLAMLLVGAWFRMYDKRCRDLRVSRPQCPSCHAVYADFLNSPLTPQA